MRNRMARGFTLLEVMMATALLAVGSVSVILVLATAAGFASRRQGQQRLTQVVEEARYDARATVNQFHPTADQPFPGAPAPKKGVPAKGAPAKDARAGAPVTVGAEPPMNHASTLFAGYSYDLTFKPVDRTVPEKGFDVTIVVHYGQDLTHTELMVIAPDIIPDEEFATSTTNDAERAGQDNTKKTRENK